MDEKAQKPENQQPPKPAQVEGGSSRLREISEAELKEILERHRLYVASDGEEGEKADLRGANLQGANLLKANLQRANLGEADLQKAKLQGAELQGAKLAKADLQKADLEKANLGAAHLQWANLQGANLRGANLRAAHLEWADLQGAELQGATLAKANLQKAYLIGANLQGAELQGTELQGTRLKGANLQGAELQGAHLSQATFETPPVRDEEVVPGTALLPTNLTDTHFRNADLSDAKLLGVTGLQADKLAGANLSNAKIPDDIAKFEGVAHVAELSKHARTNFLAVIGGCVFSWLTIAMTTDVALVTGSSATPLPIIQTKVPINGFYWAAPLILLALYFYLHLYLQRMWEGLARLPAVFPDGRTLDQTAYPWLLSGLVTAHIPLLKNKRPSLSKVQVGLSIIAAWVTVPATIFLFWFRYLPRHEWIGTGLLIVALMVATWSGIAFYRRARATLRGDDLVAVAKRPITEGIFTSLAALVIGTLSYLAIDGPSRLDLFGYGLYAEIRQAKISTKPANWTGSPFPSKDNPQSTAEEKSQAEWAQVEGAQLSGANLRYAQASGAFLAKAKLWGTNLAWAYLIGANLQGAYLWRANLQGASLQQANLQGAKLWGANLQWAKGLTQEQLDGACGDENTKLPEGLTIKPCEKEKE